MARVDREEGRCDRARERRDVNEVQRLRSAAQRGIAHRLADDAHGLVRSAARIAPRDDAARRQRSSMTGPIGRVVEIGAVGAECEVVMHRVDMTQAGAGHGANGARAQRLRPLVEVDDRALLVERRQNRGETGRRRAVPDAVGRGPQRIGVGPDVAQVEMADADVGMHERRVDGVDAADERNPVPPLGERPGTRDRDLARAAVDVSIIADDGDVQAGV
jgi:hypothetical protein